MQTTNYPDQNTSKTGCHKIIVRIVDSPEMFPTL